MYLFEYIKDCKEFMKRYPFNKNDKNSKRKIYLRNVLYVNAQPKYLLGRVISNIL